MTKKLLRLIITVIGLFLGFGLIWLLFKNQADLGLSSVFTNMRSWVRVLLYAVSTIVFGTVFFLLAPGMISGVFRLTGRLEKQTRELSMQQIFVGVIGLLIGLVIAALISLLIQKIPFTSIVILLDVIVFLVFAYLGWKIPTSRIREINLPNWFRRGESAQQVDASKAKPKVLDTSAVIDGRFFDMYRTGIVEGKIVIPRFMLDELRHIADSADPLKRSRGRRGLDAITAAQEAYPESFVISDTDYSDLDEVDTKLLRLASELGGIVVTNDYNLSKVAAVQSVPIFNINDLANSLRINVVAGEQIDVTVVKEGKEPGQGVAYFDDGTMIVLDGGGRLVGEKVTATVTSVLQTSAGRMVFAKVDTD